MTEILTSPAELRTGIAAGSYRDGGRVRILDVRWRLDRPDGHPEYREGHIPGAVYVDLETELAAYGRPTEGRHPLPPVEQLEAAVHRWGIDADDTVVVYDDLKNLSSARAWWMLRYAGLRDVRLLDGSLRGWRDAGLPLEQGDPEPPAPGTATLRYGALPVLGIEEVGAAAASGVVLDARAGERYRGDVEPIDPRAGHIPGARSAPTTENIDAEGRFLAPELLRQRFDGLGATDTVGVYCGSGVTAAHQAVALTLAGLTPVLYPGSWSQWSNHDHLPVATGPDRGAEPGRPQGATR